MSTCYRLSQPTPRLLVFTALVIGMIAMLTAAYWDYTQDDVFITYVYSRNIAEGQGFVFNPDERVQGTTTPLYTLLMAGVYRLTPDLLHAGNMLSAIFLLITCALAAGLLRRRLPPTEAIGGLSVYGRAAIVLTLVTSPLIYISFGMETLFYCAALVLAFWLWEEGRPAAAMLAAAALTWIRADGVVLGAALWLSAAWHAPDCLRRGHALRLPSGQGSELAPTLSATNGKGKGQGQAGVLPRWRSLPWKPGFVYLAGIAPWFLFAWAYFGAPLPNTFGAKQQILGGLSFLSEGLTWWQSTYGNNPLAALAFFLIALGAWRAWKQKGLRPLPLWAALYTIGYTTLNATAFWYYTPLLVVLTMLAALGGEWLARWVVEWSSGRVVKWSSGQVVKWSGGRVVGRSGGRGEHLTPEHLTPEHLTPGRGRGTSRAMVVVGAMALVVASGVLAIVRAGDYAGAPPRATTYRLLGEWVARNTPPDKTLLVGDLGIVGYHARRRTIDSPGLIVPDMHYKQDSYAVAKYKPDYVVATQYWTWQQLTAQDWFQYHYAPLVQFGAPGDDFSPMTVYRRRLPTEAPRQAVRGFDLPLSCLVRLNEHDRLPPETRARLISLDGETVVETSHPFLWGQYPAPHTPASEALLDQIALPLTVPPGAYVWEMTCDDTTHGEVEVLPVDQAPGYVSLPSAEWQGFARLRGAALPDGGDVWSGGSLTVMLDWEALVVSEQDYSVFLHLLDADGRLVAQNDGYPRGGLRPTPALSRSPERSEGADEGSSWQPGETVVDIRHLALPTDLPEGEYTLAAGWYDWRTGDRVPTTGGTDSLRLPFVVRGRQPEADGLPVEPSAPSRS